MQCLAFCLKIQCSSVHVFTVRYLLYIFKYVLQLFNFNEVAKIAVSAKNNFKINFSNINIIP